MTSAILPKPSPLLPAYIMRSYIDLSSRTHQCQSVSPPLNPNVNNFQTKSFIPLLTSAYTLEIRNRCSNCTLLVKL